MSTFVPGFPELPNWKRFTSDWRKRTDNPRNIACDARGSNIVQSPNCPVVLVRTFSTCTQFVCLKKFFAVSKTGVYPVGCKRWRLCWDSSCLKYGFGWMSSQMFHLGNLQILSTKTNVPWSDYVFRCECGLRGEIAVEIRPKGTVLRVSLDPHFSSVWAKGKTGDFRCKIMFSVSFSSKQLRELETKTVLINWRTTLVEQTLSQKHVGPGWAASVLDWLVKLAKLQLHSAFCPSLSLPQSPRDITCCCSACGTQRNQPKQNQNVTAVCISAQSRIYVSWRVAWGVHILCGTKISHCVCLKKKELVRESYNRRNIYLNEIQITDACFGNAELTSCHCDWDCSFEKLTNFSKRRHWTQKREKLQKRIGHWSSGVTPSLQDCSCGSLGGGSTEVSPIFVFLSGFGCSSLLCSFLWFMSTYVSRFLRE